jgi:2-keto-4-pentenoate hydratase/2-oxohepta-3-ene-1,7-dioic acid hydratase in catechol pathway
MRTGAMSGDDTIVDLERADASLPPDMMALLEGGDAAIGRARTAVAAAEARVAADRNGALASGLAVPIAEAVLHAPVPRPRSVLAIGLNYRDHAEESGAEIPKHPVVFAKLPTCITGPGMPVHRPKVSSALDWEAELCFVIGIAGRHIAPERAFEHIAGYTIGNDVSVRDWQFHSPTWMMGKSFDTHGPIGPWLVTRDEVDASNLDVKLWVNGELKQSSNTAQLIFGIPAIVSYLSSAFTLQPGDVVFTGTPGGVGIARKPPQFLKAGDVCRVEISCLGVLENPVIDEP